MKQLREELEALGVDYSKCIEKKDMIELLHKSGGAGKFGSKPKVNKSEGVKKLSIKGIKERLTSLGVDYSNCLEVGELVELLVATEQGHNSNPFREAKPAKEQTAPDFSKLQSKKPKSDENLVTDKPTGRSASEGLRDITGRTNEKANRQQPNVVKASIPAEQQTTQPPRDIDAADKGNVQAVTEYVRDIYTFLRRDEEKYMSGNYLESQARVISTGQRAGIVDWIVEMHQKFRMTPAVLYLAVNVLDRFMAAAKEPPSSNTIVACACLLIAAKIEEIYPPKVRDIRKTIPSISATDLCKMERLILNTLKFTVSVPTVFHFMKRYLKAADADQQLKALTMYIVESSMYDSMYHRFKPSLLAASSLSLARKMLGKTEWNSTLQAETQYGTDALRDCINGLNGLLGKVKSAPVPHSVTTKFRAPKFLEVAKVSCVAV